ncbi:hypothetical protein LINPERPRIM_LOCUS35946 [Linum perenne]
MKLDQLVESSGGTSEIRSDSLRSTGVGVDEIGEDGSSPGDRYRSYRINFPSNRLHNVSFFCDHLQLIGATKASRRRSHGGSSTTVLINHRTRKQ